VHGRQPAPNSPPPKTGKGGGDLLESTETAAQEEHILAFQAASAGLDGYKNASRRSSEDEDGRKLGKKAKGFHGLPRDVRRGGGGGGLARDCAINETAQRLGAGCQTPPDVKGKKKITRKKTEKRSDPAHLAHLKRPRRSKKERGEGGKGLKGGDVREKPRTAA